MGRERFPVVPPNLGRCSTKKPVVTTTG